MVMAAAKFPGLNPQLVARLYIPSLDTTSFGQSWRQPPYRHRSRELRRRELLTFTG